LGEAELALGQASVFIHPKAHVDDDVKIGVGSRIWQFASVTRGAILGKACSVSPGAMLDGSIYGDRVIVSGGVMAGAGFKVGSDVFIGPNVVFCNDLWPFASKDGYDDAGLRSGERFAVIVEDGVAIGAGAVILPGVRIGAGAVIAAGAVVTHDVPAAMVFNANGYIRDKINPEWEEYRMRWAK
jgi:UDP-2-acetamido-3-amino-2,3-dideoxy-glucuronate N-acetyltransferase